MHMQNMEDNTAILQKLEEHYLKEKEQVQSALEAGILGAKEAPYGFKMPWQQCFKNMKEDEARFQELAAKAITYGECYQLDLLDMTLAKLPDQLLICHQP